MGDAAKCEEEEARLQSMHNLLNQVGFQEHVYIDFAEEAYILLQKLAQSLRNMDGNGESILLETFNDYGTAMAIITFFKARVSQDAQYKPRPLTCYSFWQARGCNAIPMTSSPSWSSP